MTDIQPRILSIAESSKKYGMSEFVLYRLVKSGTLPKIPLPGRKIFLSEKILVDFLNGEKTM
jgi:predicted DNA-binding transcriptional regulator AlpA